jgi:hypothetical protein
MSFPINLSRVTISSWPSDRRTCFVLGRRRPVVRLAILTALKANAGILFQGGPRPNSFDKFSIHCSLFIPPQEAIHSELLAAMLNKRNHVSKDPSAWTQRVYNMQRKTLLPEWHITRQPSTRSGPQAVVIDLTERVDGEKKNSGGSTDIVMQCSLHWALPLLYSLYWVTYTSTV